MAWLDDLNDLILRPLDILDQKVQEKGEKLLRSLEDETAEAFLEILLGYMYIKLFSQEFFCRCVELVVFKLYKRRF